MDLQHRIMDKLEKLNHAQLHYLSQELKEYEPLTRTQAVVIHFLLVETKKRDIFTRDLEEFLDIRSSSATSLVNHLESAGYLTREAVSGDGRLRRLVLTEKAYRIEEGLTKIIEKYISQNFTGLPQEDLATCERVLDRMMANMQT